MAKGFARVEGRLDDTALDQPRAPGEQLMFLCRLHAAASAAAIWRRRAGQLAWSLPLLPPLPLPPPLPQCRVLLLRPASLAATHRSRPAELFKQWKSQAQEAGWLAP